MRTRWIAPTAILVLVAALAGCDVISGWIDDLTGGSSAQGYSSARIGFSLRGNVARTDAQAQATVIEEQTMIAAFQAAGTYDAATRTFSASWDGGDFSDTRMEIRLNATEEYVESFEVRQTRVHTLGAWSEVYELAGHDILLFHRDANSVTHLVDGSATSVILDDIDYREWSKNVGSAADPFYRLVPPQLDNVWSDVSSYVEVKLYR